MSATFGEFLEILESFCRSLFLFPSGIFWMTGILPLIGFILAVILNFYDEQPMQCFVPTPSSLLLTKYKYFYVVLDFIGLLGFVRMHFIVQRYYKYIIPKAASAAKIKIAKFLEIEKIIALIIFISKILFLISHPKKHFYIHYISLHAFFLANTAFNWVINNLNLIKYGELYPPGYELDFVSLFLNIFGMPIFLWAASKGNYFSQWYTITAVIPDIVFIITSIKFIYVGMIILGDKFFLYPESWYS